MLKNGWVISWWFQAISNTKCYLGNVKVEAKALSLPLHLPHAQLAGELTGAEAEPLQSERAVQVPLGTVPDVVERDLLQKQHAAHRNGNAAAQLEPHV